MCQFIEVELRKCEIKMHTSQEGLAGPSPDTQEDREDQGELSCLTAKALIPSMSVELSWPDCFMHSQLLAIKYQHESCRRYSALIKQDNDSAFKENECAENCRFPNLRV